ncbi:MAG: rRNA maturation RNase YbeY [Verrucomicrobiales bacterium]|jgi:probable rRNA maturation factor|nr:rRNA maturation RNase YbeY [Verrucomicrobiales bacterium]
MSAMDQPRIELFLHSEVSDEMKEILEHQIQMALPLCLASFGTEAPLLGDLDEVEISLVSDESIAEVHGEFMDDPTPTDVITFHHGEILVSVDTAEREAATHGNSVAEELLLYMIHGLLHLNGHTDGIEPDRTLMHREQETILRTVLKRPEWG